MTYFFETYGCQMNKAESASTEQLLIKRGWTAAENAESADLIIINTCSVRATAESRIHGRLGWYTMLERDRKKKGVSPFTLIVIGCMAQRYGEDLKRQFKVVDYVIGNFQTKYFGEVFESLEKGDTLKKIETTEFYNFAPVSYEKSTFSSYVPIMHGCNNFCTYCVVPYVRGRELSRCPDAILNELDFLGKNGVKEITLLGQNVNSYCWDTSKNESSTHANLSGEQASSGDFIFFPELLTKIARHLEKTNSSIEWVRFVSSHPKDLSDELIEVVAREKRICHHIHLPVQSGSTSVLQRMNRRYTREGYLKLVGRIREQIPDVSLTTDILIGFPGETDEEFEETVSLINEVKYEAAFMYYYNVREGTPAASYENQIPMEIKKARLKRIIDLQQEVTRQEMKRQLGNTVKVLVENVSHNDSSELIARTERDERVVFAADKSLIGQYVSVELQELSGITFRGKIAG